MSSKNLKFLENSSLELGFTNKSITSYGGFCLFAKLFEKIELKENLNKMFPVTEDSPNSRGVDSKLLKFGFTVLAGGERFSDTIHLGDSFRGLPRNAWFRKEDGKIIYSDHKTF